MPLELLLLGLIVPLGFLELVVPLGFILPPRVVDLRSILTALRSYRSYLRLAYKRRNTSKRRYALSSLIGSISKSSKLI